MDLEDPKMKAVVANFFDLEKAIEKDPALSHEKLAVLRSWSTNQDNIFPGMTGECTACRSSRGFKTANSQGPEI